MSMCESLLTKDIIRYFLIRGILNDFATFLEAFMPQGNRAGQCIIRLKRIAETEGNYHFMRKRIFFPAEQEIQ